MTLDDLRGRFDAVFLGDRPRGVNALGADGEDDGRRPAAVEFIAELRQAADKAALPVGRRVVVIGGGMTAVDAGGAVEAARRRGGDHRLPPRAASGWARAATSRTMRRAPGVRIVTDAAPVRVRGNGAVREVEFAYVASGPDGLAPTGETFALPADQVFKAIGQTLAGAPAGLARRARQDPRRRGRAAPACRASGPAATARSAARI